MVFIVKKKIKGNIYYYLRESRRINGKVKAVNIAYLGKDKKKAEQKAFEMNWAGKKSMEKIKNNQEISEAMKKDENKGPAALTAKGIRLQSGCGVCLSALPLKGHKDLTLMSCKLYLP